MMPAQCFLTSNLALLVLLGTVRGGPFSSRSNMTLPAPRPPPQPGGRTAEPRGGNPSSQLYEHTVEGGEKQVVFTHRINLPPSAGCGCPPGTEPPVPASEVQALRVRLEILEELVKGLKEQCTGGCCPAAAEAGTGQTDVRSLCSLHGVFDLSRCACSCEPGWGGPTCSDSTDSGVHPSHPPSASETCPDDCNDQGRCVRGRCVCFPGYTGPSCGWPSCPGDCHGRGRCVQGVCVCRAGFSGNDCSLRSCPRGCSKRGRCENGRCVCNPGYTGEDCGVRSCPRGCSQKGRCEDGRCVCDPGYTGEDCGSRSCRWDCGEGGRCVDGHCVCWPGYAGEDCSTRTCPRDCQGRGRCEDGECICDTGYSGDDCGVRSCPGDCNQRGRCEDGSCVCWPGYTGPDCGARACPRNCRGRGRCENGVCVCNAGYSGEDCGVRSCPGDCRGRGRCESGRCVCWPGYTGRDCGTRACPGDCRGRGRCVDGLCVCNPGFTGEDCGSRRCPGDCRGRGRCEDGVCACDSGYEGEDCSARSCPGGCRGRGQCLDGRCVCDDEYSGDDCSVRRCPHDCNQRGVCQDGVCTCWEGYAGEDCGLRTCPSNCHRRGRCEDGRCVCDSGYTGPSCATRTCPADCRGRGRCVQGVCVCHAGYSGEDCGQEEPPASACPGGCGPRALCRSGQCVCVEGFRGPDCAIRTCPGDCRGRGECREGSCVCQDGFAGEDCGEEVPAIEGMRMHLLEETTVRTEWTRAPGPVDAYEIQFIPTTEGESTPFTARVPSSASAYDQRGLAPGQEYQVTVRALRGTAWGPPASKTITTMIDGPQDLRVVAVTPTTLELSWLRPQAEVDRFVVSYVSAGNQRVRLEVPAEADGTLLTDLMPGVEYVVTVTAEQGRAVSYPASVRANTGSSPLGLLEATDEPPPSGPSTTQGAQAPGLQQRPQELGELRVLGRDKTGHLHVAWMAQPDTFAHFQLRLRVPDGPGVHEELLPGNVRQALVPSPPPGTPYELSLRGVTPEGEPSAPLIYQGIMDRDSEKPGKPLAPPRLGELTVTDVTSNSLLLHWTVPEGEFDSFMIQYKDRNGSQMVPVEGPQRSALITNLDMGRKYKFVLYGLVGKKRHGPLVTEAKILPQSDPGPATTPRLGMLWVTDPSPDSLLLSWTVPEGHFDSFMVQYRDRDGRPQVIPVEGPERSVIVSPLDPDHKYRFTLFGIANKKRHGPLTADGTTAPKTREEPHHPEPPEQPLLGELTVTDVTPDSLHLSWTVAQGNFDSFMVQYKDAQGQPQAVPVSGDKNEVTVRSLESDRKYKMNLYGLHGKQRVGPVSVVATTAPQEAVEETSSPTEPSTEAPEPPEEAVLGELTVTGSSSDSLSLSWTVPQGHFDSFTIQYKDRDGRPQVVRVGGEEREVTVRGLEPGRKYKMHLYGLHEGWRVGPVSTVGVTEETLEATEHPLKPRLGDMTVTDVTPNSMGLTWTVPEGKFDSFVVQYKNKDGQLQVVPVTADQLEATIPGLEPAHKYKMNLYGLHGGQRVGPLSVVAMTAPLLPAPVTESPEKPHLGELTVTDVTPDSVSLSWTVPEGEFDSFIIKYKDRDGQPQVVSVAADQLEVTVPGLEPSRKYKFMLFGIQDGRRHGPVSVEAKTETQSAVGNTGTKRPPKPRLGEELQVTSVTPDSVGLSWTVPEGQFDSFVVQYKDRNGKPQVVPVDGSFKEVSVSGLDPARRYKLLLYGLHEGKRVGPVSTIAVTAPREEIEAETMAPSPPESKPHLGELMVDEATPYTLHLSWTVAEGEFDSFEIEYTDQDGQLQVVSIGGDQNDITLSGLDSNHRYQVNLYGFHGWERMGPTQVEAMTAPKKEEDKPSEATTTTPEHLIKPHLGELAVKDATPDSLRLSWTVSEGHFDHFLLQYKNGDGQPKEVWVPGHEDGVTISGLEPDHKYKMNLYGFHDGQHQGPVSAIGVTTADEETPVPTEEEETPSPKEPSTEAPEPPEEPLLGDLTVTGSSPDSLSLSWTVPQGHFDSFTVQYKDRDGRPQVVRVGGEESEVTVRGLEPGRKYKMHLYGLHGGRRVGPVSTVGVTAPPEKEWQPPSRLGELTVTDETPDSLHLSWTVAQGPIDSFVIQYRDTNGQPQAMSVAADQREVTVEGLEPGRKYKFLLYGLIGRKRLGPVSALGVTVPEEDTPAPWHPATEAPEASEGPRLGVLAVTDRTPDSLHLAWTVAQGPFDSFVVQYWDTNGQPQALLVGGDQNKVIVSGLEPSTLYKFFLYGLHEGKRLGPVSAKGTTGSAPAGQTPGEPGPRLSQLSVTDVTTSSLRLNWEAPPGAFDSFLLRYGVPSSTLEPHPRPLLQRELTVPGTRHSAALRDLRPGTLYSFTLYGLRGPHKADSIQGTARTLSPVLESPRDLQFSEIGETSAKVSWMPPPSRVDSFKVSYQLADGGEPQSVRVDGRARTQKLKGLIPGAHYEVTVVSVRGFEESEPLTGFLTTVPDGPTQLRALNLTEGTALLHWKPPQAPVDTYDVRVTAPGAPLLQASAPGSAVDYPLHDLMLHTNYTATVHGLRGPNVTSPASITFITGLEGPQDLEAKEVTPRTARLTWTEPQVPPTGYLLTYDTPGGQTQEVMLPGGVTSYQLLGLFPSTTYRAWLRAMWGESFTPPMSTFFTTGGLRIPFPRDCGEEMQNGAGHSRTTTIFLNGNRERPLNVFCDMETDGGGWLVFQRRMDGHTDFWRDWEDYAHGFGNISGEFWLGNEALHSLTKTGDYSMRVDLRAGDEAVFAQYDSFRVDSAADYYRLHLEGYHGTAGDSMSYHSGSVFSARDRDPNNLLISCAVSYRGAWWYRNCHYANLNGLYGSTVDHQGVSWYHWKGFEFSVPFTEMKLRPRSYWAPTWGH
uniref:Tenascin XB n=1 Tax=Rousettus aegyptiacus TaxID=9407 RepID=A0A7J8KIT7_ROUAE|nr:tenascin XB [Rousettus aegyptiacus]